jgi:hypothetical protein
MLLSYLGLDPGRRRISPSGADTPRWGTTKLIRQAQSTCI